MCTRKTINLKRTELQFLRKRTSEKYATDERTELTLNSNRNSYAALKRGIKNKLKGRAYLIKEYSESLGFLYQYLNMHEVEEGLIYCQECGRWYPIGCSLVSVPEMLPDNLREKDKELEWLRKWKGKIPEHILKEGKPYNLST